MPAGPAAVSLDRVPLDHGAVMALLPLLAALALAATVVRRDRRWWSVTLPLLLAGTGTVLVAVAWYLHDHIIRDHYPKSFGIWVGEALFAAAAAVAGWRGAGRWRRIVAVAGVPLTVASAFVLINAQYAYWPTVGDLLGRPLPHEMTAAALADVLARQTDTPAGTTVPSVAPGGPASGPAFLAGAPGGAAALSSAGATGGSAGTGSSLGPGASATAGSAATGTDPAGAWPAGCSNDPAAGTDGAGGTSTAGGSDRAVGTSRASGTDRADGASPAGGTSPAGSTSASGSAGPAGRSDGSVPACGNDGTGGEARAGSGAPAGANKASAGSAAPADSGPSGRSDPSRSPGFSASSTDDPAAGSAPADSSGASTAAAAAHRHPDRAGHRARTSAAAAQPTMHGALAPLDIPGTRSGFNARRGALYLPPAFFASPRPALPVIVMVGGTPGGPEDWPRPGFAAQTADLYASGHGGLAPILAFVDHNGGPFADTECVDGPAGAAETYLAVDVPRYLAGELHVPPDPRHWAIAGFSEGGTCAFELAARHPDVYGAFLDVAGDWAPNQGSEADTLKNIYGGDRAAMAAHDPANLLTANRLRGSRGWFVVGTSDRTHVAVADRLAAAARPSGLVTSRTFLPGGHNWPLAGTAFRTVLPDLMRALSGSQST